jgi:hypothetical protein
VPTVNSSLVGFSPLQIQALDGTYASLTANQTISGTNIFTGAVTFNGTINFGGTVNFSGTINFSGTVNYSGNTNFSGTNIFTTAQINTLSVGTSGTVGALDIYPSTTALGKTRVTSSDNSGNTTTTINVASQAGIRTYTIPDAGASASTVMTEGAATINGVKTLTGNNLHTGTNTFSGTIKVGQNGSAGMAELYPNTTASGKTTFTMTDNSGNTTTAWVMGAQTGARTYTTPDAGASASYVMSEGTSTVNGNKTLTGANTHSGINTFTSTIKFGQSGTAGAPELYPATSASGKTTFTMADNVGDTTTNVNFASQSGSRTYTVSDVGSSSSFAMTEGAQTINGIKTLTGANIHSGANTFTSTNTFSNTTTFTGTIKAGQSGTAGLVELYPATSAKGKTTFTMTNNSGDTTTNVNVAAQSGARTYTVSDVGASASYVMTEGAQTINGAKTFSTPLTVASGGTGTAYSSLMDYRLTLTSGTPVTTADVIAAGTIYLTPCTGKNLALYDGANWVVYSPGELSLAVPAAANAAYDLFCYSNSGTPTLEATAWTNDTTRATALVYQDGVLVKSGATTRRYVGSFRTKTASQVTDSGAFRHLWSYYNRVLKACFVTEATASWSYNSGTWHQANASSANQFDFMIGVSEDMVFANVTATGSSTSVGTGAGVAIGLDSSTVLSGTSGNFVVQTSGYWMTFSANYAGYPGIGRHFLSWMEYGTAFTFFSTGGSGGTQANSGIQGYIRC